jgi:DNA invertase Pin-like site-specific DNA recombinase
VRATRLCLNFLRTTAVSPPGDGPHGESTRRRRHLFRRNTKNGRPPVAATDLTERTDRLARSVADLCASVKRIEAKGVALRILAISLDTATPTGKLMLNMLGSVAQFEREMMLERQREGIAPGCGRGQVQRQSANSEGQER